MNIREIDTADWEASERAEVVALPYTVISSPYGETLFQAFATEAEAVEAAEYVQGLTGTYNTSWGEQAVNTEFVISHYVDSTPDVEAVYTVTTTAGARLGYPAHAIRDTRADAIDVANHLHAVRVSNGATGVDAVRVEHGGEVVWAIRDNGTIIS